MKRLNNKGFLLAEILAALGIAVVVIGVAWMFLNTMIKDWFHAQSSIEVNYNSKDALNRLVKEIRESSGVEILDSSEKGWIKVFKSKDKSSFVTFRAKNEKLFVGFNNVLNSNSELADNIKTFKVEYIPKDASPDKALGVKIYISAVNKDKKFSTNTSVAFRVKD